MIKNELKLLLYSHFGVQQRTTSKTKKNLQMQTIHHYIENILCE